MPQKTKDQKEVHRHHIRRLHLQRVSWFVFLAIGLLGIQVVAGFQTASASRPQVLAYATNVSIGDLLTATNQARSTNGLGGLAINGKLNNSAQAKGNDMIGKNYWSHNAPDGTQPWAFFTAAGYKYSKAGENLAYGFDTSNQIVDAWMNSAGHRANILGDYKDVGFGISSGDNYQGGQFTVVVSHYGKPTAGSTPKSTTPKIESKPAPEPVTVPEPEPGEPPQEPPAIIQTAPQETKKVTNLETLLGGQAGWAMYASLSLVGVTSLGFAGTHWQLVRRGWKESRHFILVHPALDTAVIAAIIALLLSSAAGFIK